MAGTILWMRFGALLMKGDHRKVPITVIIFSPVTQLFSYMCLKTSIMTCTDFIAMCIRLCVLWCDHTNVCVCVCMMHFYPPFRRLVLLGLTLMPLHFINQLRLHPCRARFDVFSFLFHFTYTSQRVFAAKENERELSEVLQTSPVENMRKKNISNWNARLSFCELYL